MDKKSVKKAVDFVTAHGKTARAVIEPIGRAGVRIVLVGEDGAMGDVLVPTVADAEALVNAIPELETAEWDRETTSQLKIGSAHRKKMATMQQ